MLKDNKINEILDMLRADSENYIGNLRYRLRTELDKENVNLQRIGEIANKILDTEPLDVMAGLYLAFAEKEEHQREYKEAISDLSGRELMPYQIKLIAKHLIKHYEPLYKGVTEEFLKKSGVYDDYYTGLMEKIAQGKQHVDELDPGIERDVLILSADEEGGTARTIAASLESAGIKCWYAERNLDKNADRESFIERVVEGCTVDLLVYRDGTLDDKHLRNTLTLCAKKQEASGFSARIVYALDNSPRPPVKFFDGATSVSSDDSISFLIKAVKACLDAYNNRDSIQLNSKTRDIVALIDRGLYGKAIRELEDLLEESYDNKELRKLLLRAQIENGEGDSRGARANFEYLKRIASSFEIEMLEDKYPVLIDDEEEMKKGMELYRTKSFNEAVHYFTRASKKNNKEALNKLGEAYFMGKGLPRDPQNAIKYYTLASDAGCADAQRALGVIYTMGAIVPKDLAKAFSFFQKGAENGNAFCMLKTADCYRDGNGTVQSYPKAFEYYKKSAELGLADAIYNLGICFKYGRGTEVNQAYASECFKVSASKGNQDAKRELYGF